MLLLPFVYGSNLLLLFAGKNSNMSQFFITYRATSDLDGKHVVFGQVVEGIQVLDKVAAEVKRAKDEGREPQVVIHDCGQL